MKKIKIGYFSFCSCEGCSVIFSNYLVKNWEKLKDTVEISNYRFMKDLSNNETDKFDIVFIEGAIANEKQEEEVKKLRKLSKVVVAVGNCAICGYPSCLRNTLGKNDYMCRPTKAIIKVDYEVHGCPAMYSEIEKIFKLVLKSENK